jgi:hypothetical protein
MLRALAAVAAVAVTAAAVVRLSSVSHARGVAEVLKPVVMPTDVNLHRIGRWTDNNATHQSFDWGGTTIRMRMSGTSSLGILLKVRARVRDCEVTTCLRQTVVAGNDHQPVSNQRQAHGCPDQCP